MLTRRHIRAKVMQSLYALFRQDTANVTTEKKFLDTSMADMYDMFLLDLSLLVEVREHAKEYFERSKEKYLATEDDVNPNLKFVNNAVIDQIEASEGFNDLLESKNLTNWRKEPSYVQIIWDELLKSELYKTYTSTRETSFREDKDFVVAFFKEIIAPNEKLHDYLEDTKLTWMDDLPIVNTAILKTLKKVKESDGFHLPRLFKNEEDREFAFALFNKTITYKADFESTIEEKTPNWDKDRLADIDAILIKMALCEFVNFPSIPVKVSINEYLEISKEYSTPKSSVFINGVLDKISKDYQTEGKLNKRGRGLL